MACTIRPLAPDDESFLWEMLYHAIYVPEGQASPRRKVIRQPELARYVRDWGREGDCGFLASVDRPVGAVWLRFWASDDRGFGYVDDHTPELSIAVLPDYRSRGIGTQLLSHLLASACGRSSISLSVSAENPAWRLYERFGFQIVSDSAESLTMKRS